MNAVDGFRTDGRCRLNFDVDGAQITRLFAHVDSGTVMRAVEYPAESRVVLDLGERSAGGVAVFLRAAELARLIDVLNAAYTRIACRPREDAPPIRGADLSARDARPDRLAPSRPGVCPQFLHRVRRQS